jgi:amino acid transporter
MPIVIYVYLLVNVGVTIYAYKNFFSDLSEYWDILVGFTVTGNKFLLVLAYYYSSIGDFFGFYIFIFVVLGIAYHFKYRHSYIYEPEDDIQDIKEKRLYRYFNLVLVVINSILILPAYILGFLSGIKYV